MAATVSSLERYEGNTTYFAAEQESHIAATRALMRIRAYQDDITDRGILKAITDAHDMYFSRDRDGNGNTPHRARLAGARGEYVVVKSPRFASMARLLRTITTAQLPDTVPSADNSDSSSESAAILGRDLLLEYRLKKRLETLWIQAVQGAYLYNWSFMSVLWDPSLGAERDPEMGPEHGLWDRETAEFLGPRREGDVRHAVHNPLDVTLDIWRPDQEHRWLMLTRWPNKFDLAAEVLAMPPPEGEDPAAWQKRQAQLAESIRAYSVPLTPDSQNRTWYRLTWGRRTQPVKWVTSDLVPEHILFHASTPALPGGRTFRFLTPDIVLDDGPLPYDEIPVYPLAPEWEADSPYGHSPLQDAMGLQEVHDAAISTAVSRNKASKPKLLTSRSAAAEKRALDSAFANIEVTGNPNEVAKVFEFNPDVSHDVALAQFAGQQMDELVGLNEAVRGQVESATASGSRVAFQQEQALLANANVKQGLHDLMRKTSWATLRAHQLFNDYPRKLEQIAGKRRGGRVARQYVGKDLMAISGVTVNTQGTFRSTPEARMELLQLFAKLGVPIRDPESLITFAETGRWDAAIEDARDEDQFIRDENELIAQGIKPARPTWSENPIKHLLCHSASLYSQEAKESPAIMAAAQEHLLEHLEEWALMPDGILIALKVTDPNGVPLRPGPTMAPAMVDPATGQPMPVDAGAGGAPPSDVDSPAEMPGAAEPELPTLPNGADSAPLTQGETTSPFPQ